MSRDVDIFARDCGINISESAPSDREMLRLANYRESDLRANLDQAIAELKAHRVEGARLKRISHRWATAFWVTLAIALVHAAICAGKWPL